MGKLLNRLALAIGLMAALALLSVPFVVFFFGVLVAEMIVFVVLLSYGALLPLSVVSKELREGAQFAWKWARGIDLEAGCEVGIEPLGAAFGIMFAFAAGLIAIERDQTPKSYFGMCLNMVGMLLTVGTMVGIMRARQSASDNKRIYNAATIRFGEWVLGLALAIAVFVGLFHLAGAFPGEYKTLRIQPELKPYESERTNPGTFGLDVRVPIGRRDLLKLGSIDIDLVVTIPKAINQQYELRNWQLAPLEEEHKVYPPPGESTPIAIPSESLEDGEAGTVTFLLRNLSKPMRFRFLLYPRKEPITKQENARIAANRIMENGLFKIEAQVPDE